MTFETDEEDITSSADLLNEISNYAQDLLTRNGPIEAENIIRRICSDLHISRSDVKYGLSYAQALGKISIDPASWTYSLPKTEIVHEMIEILRDKIMVEDDRKYNDAPREEVMAAEDIFRIASETLEQVIPKIILASKADGWDEGFRAKSKNESSTGIYNPYRN
jgi:hypothetical protein